MLLRDISPPETLKRAIEAKQQAEQEALAMSPNTRIIVVGNKQGLPLILGQ